jgi:flagellar basal-body rod modification protein FlgD
MTVSSVFNNYSATTVQKAETATANKGGGLNSLGSGDFLKLMTVQMQQQDPLSPVDQKEMLAQMAQFSSLAGTTEMGDTLKAISNKLDVLMKSQPAAPTNPTTTTTV